MPATPEHLAATQQATEAGRRASTPTTARGLTAYDHLDATEAILRAWVVPGPNPYWHTKMQAEVRASMPLLARALDRLHERRR